jgi:hypothetical protein
VAVLLDRLRWAGAQEQITVLLARDPAAHVSLDDPSAVAGRLGSLQRAGAQEQITVLLRRDLAAHVSLSESWLVAVLLGQLRKAGGQEQATALADRLPGAGEFELFCRKEDPQNRFRFGREADGSRAEPWDWGDLD